jgi:CheY-like chemotaxis protein
MGLWMADAARSMLEGRRVLVVEDEYVIAVDLARALEDLGATVIGPAASVADALGFVAEDSALDFAILDVNLGIEKVFPVAEVLRARGVPFIFTTGYEQWLIPSAYADAPRFEKPVDTRVLARALSNSE